jgi:adenylosuccinate lyase
VKLAGFAFEAHRNVERLEGAVRAGERGAALSGAVGTYSATLAGLRAARARAARPRCRGRLHAGRPARPPRRAAQRDRRGGRRLERLATEIRHLQRTEVRETEEPFRSGQQKGSSAMPHKRNRSRRADHGLARVLRGNAQAATENVALWHERDISHSGAERVILPDSTILLDYMQSLATRVVSGLVVHADRMRANIDLTHGAALQPARAAGARGGRHDTRRGLPDRPGGRPARVGHRHAAARPAGARATSASTSTRSSTSPTTRATRARSSTRLDAIAPDVAVAG